MIILRTTIGSLPFRHNEAQPILMRIGMLVSYALNSAWGLAVRPPLIRNASGKLYCVAGASTPG